MRMLVLLSMTGMGPPDLESPDVIAELHPVHEAGLGELRQVAVDRGAVEATVGQGGRDLGVRPRAPGLKQVLEHRQTGRRAPQARVADDGPDRIEIWGGFPAHPISLPLHGKSHP
jgi:hypothetical protein